MSIEAMKLALEALERSVSTCFDRRAYEDVMSRPEHFINQTITALRTAIAEAESVEPYGYVSIGDLPVFRKETPEIGRWETVYTTPPAAQRQPLNWTVVGEQMPDSGVIVLAYYKNSHGKDRRIRAKWVAAKTMEASGDWEGDCDYDEEADTYYCPAGWYECIDNWPEYTSVFVHEGQITHWMPLPESPAIEAAHGIKEKNR